MKCQIMSKCLVKRLKRKRSIINSRIRSSRSHESLLTNSVTMHSIDLASQELDIKPLHSSVLGQDHCFQVSTSNGSKYISCRTAEEREKWLGSLRKTVQPNQDNIRRTDNSLKLWIKEAKNVPSKKRYYCEIHLDKTLYARTSSKTKADMLFWGEHFEFNNLPPLETVTVNLYREADKKKKKDRNCLIGYVNITVAEISTRQYVEKWFTTSSGTVGKMGKENKSELPLIRLKARFQVVDILPMELYQDFTQYLSQDFCNLCEVLEQLVSVREKEELATTMVHIMQKLNKAKDFLSDVIMAEISQLENQNLVFRGNTIGTKAMEAYMKLVGEKYLRDTLSDFVKNIIESDDDCEVDPTKVLNPAQLNSHQRLLDMYCEMVLAKIINSHCYFPWELREVFSSFRDHCDKSSKKDFGDNLISASIFLRFLCPAILSPSLFNLTQEYPPERAARNLTLIAKTVQTLANFSKFGGKEEFMTFMNDFLERQWGSMRSFIHQISSTEGSNQFLEFDGYIDLGKELSVLHSLLLENLGKADKETLAKLGNLPAILEGITQAMEDPEMSKCVPVKSNRKSQIYDNLVNTPPSYPSTSPTEFLRDLLHHCGEDDIPVLSSRRGTNPGSFDGSVSSGNNGRNPARHLDTNDDYVMIRALNSKNESGVSDVSVNSRSNTLETNQSWNEIVNAAEGLNGEYIDLLSYEDPQNSSMELEHNMNGSQMSISQISTIASSGYQSFGYSQSNSPVESSNQQDVTNRDYSSKSPSGHHHPMQPLSFSNPMYRHLHSSSSGGRVPTPMQQGSTSSGSLSSEEDSNTVKHRSPIKHSDRNESSSSYGNHGGDPLRNLAPKLSSSSSSESLHEHDCHRFTRSLSSPHNDPVKFSLDFHSSCPSHIFEDLHNSNVSSTTNGSNSNSYSLSRAPSRPHELIHTGSVDFTYMRQKYGDQLRRTATDSRISQNNSTPVHTLSDNGVSNRNQISPEDSPAHRRLSPQTTVHMGIRSVQRKIHEQEKTKQEYEQEVEVLKQQVADAQKRLQTAEKLLQEQESGTHQLVEDWQYRLEESEERMKKQQMDKDDQMKHIIQRLMTIESEQEEMEKLVHQKQRVIEAQERRIQSLDNANAKLMSALSQLKDQYSTPQPRNGMLGPLRSKLTPSEFAEFKTSSC